MNDRLRRLTMLENDGPLLDAVLAHEGLDARLRGPFENMRKNLGRFNALSLRQRQWVQNEAHRLGLPVAPCDHPGKAEPSPWDPKAKKRPRYRR